MSHFLNLLSTAIGTSIPLLIMLRIYRTQIEWNRKTEEQLLEHAKWAHRAIRLIAEKAGVNVDEAPDVSRSTPPPPMLRFT